MKISQIPDRIEITEELKKKRSENAVVRKRQRIWSFEVDRLKTEIPIMKEIYRLNFLFITKDKAIGL